VEIMGADPRFEPVALVDVNASVMAGAAEHLQLPASACFSDLGDAIGRVDADACVICTPTRTHAELARIAFAHGLHVLVEKGMTTHWDDAVRLVDDAASADVKLCVAQNYRFAGWEQTVTAILADPSHPHNPGDVRIADCVHHRYRPDPLTLDYPYAMVWDQGVHHVDSLSFWLGPVARVTARSSNTPWSRYEHEANIGAVIEYASGATCHFVLTHAATFGSFGVVLQGERGALRILDDSGLLFHPRPAEQWGASEGEPCELIDGLATPEQCIADAFYAYVTDGVEPGISGRNNLETLLVCELLVRSASEGRTVEVGEVRPS
jgi:predicted dehydrogenase